MTTGTTIGTTEPLRLRHEVKHQLSPQEDLVLTSRLQKLFPRDGHAGPAGSHRAVSYTHLGVWREITLPWRVSVR